MDGCVSTLTDKHDTYRIPSLSQKGLMMHRKLFAGLLASAMLTSLASVIPAQAGNKALIEFIHTDLHDNNQKGTGDPKGGTLGCDPTVKADPAKDKCRPWVYFVDGWPRVTPSNTDQVGGHFHKQYVATKNGVTNIWDQEVNLVKSHSKASTSINYFEAACVVGGADGMLALQYREQVKLTNPLLKAHNQPLKEDAHYNVLLIEKARFAILILLDKKKDAVIILVVIKEPKLAGGPAELAARCLEIDNNDPLKMSFDLTGISVTF